jgi:hypothetical protein
MGPEPAPAVWAVQLPPTSGVDPTRLPLVEKSSLKRTVADAAANRTLTKKTRSIVVALHESSKERSRFSKTLSES